MSREEKEELRSEFREVHKFTVPDISYDYKPHLAGGIQENGICNAFQPENTRDERGIGQKLKKRRGARVAEERSQETANSTVMVKYVRDVEYGIEGKDRKRAELLKFVHAVRDETGRKHDQKDAGHIKDHREIRLESEPEKRVSDEHRNRNTQERADELARLSDDSTCL